MAEPALGPQPCLRTEDCAQQLVGVQATLHQVGRLAGAHQLDREYGGVMAVVRRQ